MSNANTFKKREYYKDGWSGRSTYQLQTGCIKICAEATTHVSLIEICHI